MLLGQAVMVNWSDVAEADRAEYYAWHGPEHMVGRVSLPGFLRGRRFLAQRASRDILVLYEVDSIEVLKGADYLAKANSPSPLTQRTTKLIHNSARALACVRMTLGIGLGGVVLTLRFEAEDHKAEALERYLAEKALVRVSQMPGIVGAHLCIADKEVSSIVPAERHGRPTTIPNWIVIIEGISIASLERACDEQLDSEVLLSNGAMPQIERDTYSHQLLVLKPVGSAV